MKIDVDKVLRERLPRTTGTSRALLCGGLNAPSARTSSTRFSSKMAGKEQCGCCHCRPRRDGHHHRGDWAGAITAGTLHVCVQPSAGRPWRPGAHLAAGQPLWPQDQVSGQRPAHGCGAPAWRVPAREQVRQPVARCRCRYRAGLEERQPVHHLPCWTVLAHAARRLHRRPALAKGCRGACRELPARHCAHLFRCPQFQVLLPFRQVAQEVGHQVQHRTHLPAQGDD